MPDKLKQINPITYTRAKSQPFLIRHSTADCNVPPPQDKLLTDAPTPLICAGNVTYQLIEDVGHGEAQFKTAENDKFVIDFLNKHLKV